MIYSRSGFEFQSCTNQGRCGWAQIDNELDWRICIGRKRQPSFVFKKTVEYYMTEAASQGRLSTFVLCYTWTTSGYQTCDDRHLGTYLCWCVYCLPVRWERDISLRCEVESDHGRGDSIYCPYLTIRTNGVPHCGIRLFPDAIS